MDIFSESDLRERTGDLIRGAESGELSIITKAGHIASTIACTQVPCNQGNLP